MACTSSAAARLRRPCFLLLAAPHRSQRSFPHRAFPGIASLCRRACNCTAAVISSVYAPCWMVCWKKNCWTTPHSCIWRWTIPLKPVSPAGLPPATRPGCRHICRHWNPPVMPPAALPPCNGPVPPRSCGCRVMPAARSSPPQGWNKNSVWPNCRCRRMPPCCNRC